MFENLTKSESKEKIFSIIEEYYAKFHINDKLNKKEKISYSGRVYDEKEMKNLVDAALDFWLTAGKYSDEFERLFSEYLGVKYCSLVNSGSSANLIAFMTLTSPLLKERAIQRGDEVITVAAGFPTTVSPIIQYGAIPVFVDITIPKYNIDVSMLELALSSKTKAVMLAHTLGNPFDIKSIKEFCDRNKLWLIEDNCDALGSVYKLDEEAKFTGTVGDIGTSSFYPPHHITMGEGGAVYTNNPLLNKISRSLRDWGRDCMCPSGQDNICEHRFERQYGQLPFGYDHKYVYSHFGYNLKATDMQAAIGCAQLEKLDLFTKKRKQNFKALKEKLEIIADKIILPEPCENSEPSWFGFPITCRNNGERNIVVSYLEKSGIQTRMLFAGNIIKHPCFDNMRKDGRGYRVVGNLENTDIVMENTFWIGVYPGMTEDNIDYMANKIIEVIEGI